MSENNKRQNTLCDRLENEPEENDCKILITDLSKDIDFTFTKPIYFELFGEKYSALKSWRQLYIKVSSLLYNYNTSGFLSLPDRIIANNKIAKKKYYNPVEIAPDISIETNRPSNNLISNIRTIMDAVNLDYCELVIAYSKGHVICSDDIKNIDCADSATEEKSNNLETTECNYEQENKSDSEKSFGGISGFVLWLIDTGASERKALSCLKYLQALNRYAKLCGMITSDIYTIEDVEKLEGIKDKIERNPIWGKLKTSGHKRYSSAMIKYIEYVRTHTQSKENLLSREKDNIQFDFEESEIENFSGNNLNEIETNIESTELQSEDRSNDTIILNESQRQEYSRHEREGMYQDSIHLIVRSADTAFLSGCREKEEVDEYTRLRNRIMKEFPKVKLLCEIEISDREYEILCQHERKHYLSLLSNRTYRDIMLSVTLVQIGIHNYHGAYWPHVKEVLGNDGKEVPNNIIGSIFTETMLAAGKPIFKETEYVSNILLHCFITDDFADSFFEFLYKYYDLDLKRNISSDRVEESRYISEAIKNPYSKRQQFLSNYVGLSIRGNYDYCNEIISQLLHMIDCSFWGEEIDGHYTGRLVERFSKWYRESSFIQKEEAKRKRAIRSGKREKRYWSPYLMCDLENSKFSLMLPSLLVEGTFENKNIIWEIFCDDVNEKINCEIEEGYSGFKTNLIRMNISEKDIFNEFRIKLYADEKTIRTYKWDKTVAQFFDENGEWIKDEHLSEGRCIAFSLPDVKIESDGMLYRGTRVGLNYYELNLKSGDLVQVPSLCTYYVGDIPEQGLTKGNIIRGLAIEYDGKLLNAYSKLPSLIVEVEDGKFGGTAIEVNGQRSKLSDRDFLEIKIGKRTDRKYYYMSFNSMQGIHNGINCIVINFPATLRRLYYDFFYLPDFDYRFINGSLEESSETDEPYIFMNRGTLLINRKIDKNVILGDKVVDAQYHKVDFSNLKLSQYFLPLKINDQEFQADFDVPVFLYSWDKENWFMQKSDDIWYADFQSVLYVKFPSSALTIRVKEKNTNNDFTFFRNAEGTFICDLTKLKSYLDNSKYVNVIYLIFNNREYDIFHIIMKSMLLSVLLNTDYEKECIQGVFNIIGKGDYYTDVICGNQVVLEKEYIPSNRTLNMKIPIKSAKYIVKVFEAEGGEFSFDEDYTFIGQNEMQLINRSELNGVAFNIDSIASIDRKDIVRLRLNYNYTTFIEKKIDRHTYRGLLVEIFHDDTVSRAFPVYIHIPDLNTITQMTILLEDREYEEESEFLYDIYKHCLVDIQDPKYGTAEAYRRYAYVLFQESFIWYSHFTAFDQNVYLKGVKRLQEKTNRNKKNSIWKDGSSENDDILKKPKGNSIVFKKTDIPIEDLNLSKRSYNCLIRAKIYTVDQALKRIEDGSILKIRNLGRKSTEEIIAKIDKLNYK